MASTWNGEPLDPHAVATVQVFMHLMHAASPRDRVRCLCGLALSLDDQEVSIPPTEIALRRACIQELRALLRQRAG